LGDGGPKLALGGPPGGGPRGRPVIGPLYALHKRNTRSLGGSGGGPGGAPGGSLWGPGGLWGVRGPLPGGYPPGGPLVAALPTDNTALLEPPPRGAPRGGPPGGHFWGVPTGGGQNQAKARFTVVSRGGRGAPPTAHGVGSLPGGPKRAQWSAGVGAQLTKIPAAPLGGAPPMGGRGPEAGPGGPPPGGTPGPPRHRPRVRPTTPAKRPGGGPGGGPWGGPGGVSVGPRGPLGGSGGPSRGGTPRGAPWWPPSLRTILPFRSRPPGGHFWRVRTRWGQNQAKSSLPVVYRGGRGAPPKAHWVRSLQGGPKRAQF
jgi:translation initiation factor IF-2